MAGNRTTFSLYDLKGGLTVYLICGVRKNGAFCFCFLIVSRERGSLHRTVVCGGYGAIATCDGPFYRTLIVVASTAMFRLGYGFFALPSGMIFIAICMGRMIVRESIPHCQAGEEDSLDLFIVIRRNQGKKARQCLQYNEHQKDELPA